MLYFYDTPDLHLFNAGVALRARLVKGDADDSTLKFRLIEAARISSEISDHTVSRAILRKPSLSTLARSPVRYHPSIKSVDDATSR